MSSGNNVKNIPERKRIPLITDLPETRRIIKDPLAWSIAKAGKYGDVCYVPLPGVKNYLVHDHEVLKEILITQSGKFRKSRLYRAMKKFLGDGLFTSEGGLHKQQRKLINPAFHKQRIQQYAEIMVQCTLHEINNWKEGDTVNISQAMTNITLQVVTNTLFGAGMDPQVLKRVSDNITLILEITNKMFSNPVYLFCFEQNIQTPLIKRFYSLKKEMDEIIQQIIDSYRENPSVERHDLLSMLMLAQDEETGQVMSNEQIKDEVMVIFLAGHETTATAMSWAWYLIGKHPELGKLFYKEIRETIVNRLPSAEDYQALNLTRNIFKEALRLYPPAWTFAREAIEDVDIQGYHFPKGSLVCCIIYIMHRKEEYFSKPDEFIPSRWDDEKMKELPKCVYFPFGAGNRMCIGEGFAWMEALMILSTIASRFNLQLPDGFKTNVNPVFTLRTKDNIFMNLKNPLTDYV